jgi:hypothetical protein
MKKQAFVLTLAILLLALMVPMVILMNAQADKKSSNGGDSDRFGERSDEIGPGQIDDVQQVGLGQIEAGEYRLSGPYTHKNLTIFLVHGKNLVSGNSFLTLQEALEEIKVVVY